MESVERFGDLGNCICFGLFSRKKMEDLLKMQSILSKCLKNPLFTLYSFGPDSIHVGALFTGVHRLAGL